MCKKKINRVCFLLFFFNFSTSWLAVSWRSGRLLFTASAASRQSRDLTVRAPGCHSAAFGHCHSGDWCRCRCGAKLREVGHGPVGCVQSKQGLIMHKVSHAPLFFDSLLMCVKGRERVVSVSITIITRAPSPGGLHDPQSSWFSLHFCQRPLLYAGFLSLFFCLFERER